MSTPRQSAMALLTLVATAADLDEVMDVVESLIADEFTEAANAGGSIDAGNYQLGRIVAELAVLAGCVITHLAVEIDAPVPDVLAALGRYAAGDDSGSAT